MRTLGYRRSHILGFILSESVLMSLLGGILGVLLAKQEVHVVVGRRPAARPRREPAPEQHRDARRVECPGRLLHRLDQGREGLGWRLAHAPGIPGAAAPGTWAGLRNG